VIVFPNGLMSPVLAGAISMLTMQRRGRAGIKPWVKLSRVAASENHGEDANRNGTA